MLAVERRRLIAENLRSRGVVSVAEMAGLLNTTEITVRRDLRAMAKEGQLVRAHGGAVLPAAIGHEPSYSEKARQAGAEKASIAHLALAMILPGDSILLGPGTTTLALARLLGEIPELTVVTNSLLVAQALMTSTRVEVILTGGTLRRSIHALVGPAAEESVRALRRRRRSSPATGSHPSGGCRHPARSSLRPTALSRARRSRSSSLRTTRRSARTRCVRPSRRRVSTR